MWRSWCHQGDWVGKTLVLCLARSSLLHNFAAGLATKALSSSSSPLPSPSRPSWMGDRENTGIIPTPEPAVCTLTKSNLWPPLEQTKWWGSGLSFSFLYSSFPVFSFLLSLGDPAEPQGRRRELLHGEVSRPGMTSAWLITVELTICHLQPAFGWSPRTLNVPRDPRASSSFVFRAK